VTNQWKPWQKSCFFCGQWITWWNLSKDSIGFLG
jgi:hypothetical protein